MLCPGLVDTNMGETPRLSGLDDPAKWISGGCRATTRRSSPSRSGTIVCRRDPRRARISSSRIPRSWSPCSKRVDSDLAGPRSRRNATKIPPSAQHPQVSPATTADEGVPMGVPRALAGRRAPGRARPSSGRRVLAAEERLLGRDVDVRRALRAGRSAAVRAARRAQGDRRRPTAVYPQQAPGYDCRGRDPVPRDARGRGPVSDVPIAPLIGYEDDPSVLGAPFFVMGFVDGEVPIESPLVHGRRGSSWTRRRRPRRAMIDDGLACPRAGCTRSTGAAPGLDWLVPPGVEPGTAQQLDVWEDYARRELDGREHPVLDAWVRVAARATARPRSTRRPAGRRVLGRRATRQHDLAGITAACAPPTSRPCRSRHRTRTSAGGSCSTAGRTRASASRRLDGEPTRDEQRAIYAEAAGMRRPRHDVPRGVRRGPLLPRSSCAS